MVLLNDYLPQPLHHNAYQLSRDISLGCSQFARHYCGNRYYFLFLRLLRCFSSAGCLPLRDVTVLTVTGFPIRKSPDQSYFDSSPKHIAANRVLHRLVLPRYPLRAAVT